jgi:hypothetical protein
MLLNEHWVLRLIVFVWLLHRFEMAQRSMMNYVAVFLNFTFLATMLIVSYAARLFLAEAYSRLMAVVS